MTPVATPSNKALAWARLIVATIFGWALLYLIWDLKRDVTRSLDAAQQTIETANESVSVVNEKLPLIVDEVKRGTETLSSVAADVELIKSVAGIRSEQNRGIRDLAVYANEIQQVLGNVAEQTDAVVMIEEVFGSDLKVHEPLGEFLVGLSKEMVVFILPLAKSKQEILYRVCHSGPPRRKPFFIRVGQSTPIAMDQLIKRRHAGSADLPDYTP